MTRLPLERLSCDDDLRRQWRALAAHDGNPYALYQSPEWFDHVCHTAREELRPPLALIGEGGRLDGLALPYRKLHLLPFQIRNYSLWRLRLSTTAFLGCEPSFPQNDEAYDRLLAAVLEDEPGTAGIYLHSVPTQGFLWGYLQRSRWVADHLLVHIPDGIRRFHALDLPPDFDQYLSAQFRKKKRYNLKRQLRLLKERGQGELRLERVESCERVKWFAEAAGRVAAYSWQARWMLPDTLLSLRRPAWLEDLARRRLLRSYVLLCGETPCAMVLGYQAGDVFHYSETGYDERFAEYSAGSVLLYLMIEDLIAHRSPRRVSFGAGDSRYKAEFANTHWADAPALLLRRGARGSVLRASHTWFRNSIEWMKRRYTSCPDSIEGGTQA